MSSLPISEPPPWRTVILSPHFDDAVLSLAGLLPELPGPTAVVTVHGGAPDAGVPASGWDDLGGFSTGAEAHRVRRAEDARACALLGVEQVTIDHPDGPYVEGGLQPTALDTLLRSLAPGTRVLTPLGTNQRDHRAVRLRAMRVLAETGAPAPWVYADLPYTGHLPEWDTAQACEALAESEAYGLAYQELRRDHRLTVRHELRLDDDRWAAKREAVLCHASQLAALVPGHGDFLVRNGPLRTERIWSLEPLATADTSR
ncbi:MULTISPECIES: PIG-L deacetylase family protein [unclassified Streptomyces]|uniref:PIG-L deacetylase family protein n=1 Tax=unclassified Streptomyces TaxID=2593676 RepID=UPI002DD90162|nr:PIG-L family deacetylase [Streptomyces sp. NBC_01237]WRZ76077.1 PIG-L family deacetylase [Streptomyces sp. NBC_01237]